MAEKAWVWGGKWHIYKGSVGQTASDKAMNPRLSPDSAFCWLYYLGQAILLSKFFSSIKLGQ